MLDTLLAAEAGTYHSKVSAAQFVSTYLKNLGIEVLNKSVVGKAFTKTMTDLDVKVGKMVDSVSAQLEQLAEEKAKKVTQELLQLEAPKDTKE